MIAMFVRLAMAAAVVGVTYELIRIWRRPSHKLSRLDLPELGVSGPVILQFSAPFCAPCKVAKPHLIAAADEAAITYAQIDVQERPDVGAKYGIRSVPTIVVADGSGAVLGRWTKLPANGEIHRTAELAAASR